MTSQFTARLSATNESAQSETSVTHSQPSQPTIDDPTIWSTCRFSCGPLTSYRWWPEYNLVIYKHGAIEVTRHWAQRIDDLNEIAQIVERVKPRYLGKW
jgi:hypothetical protein